MTNEKHIISFDGYGYICTCGSRYNSSVGARLHIEEIEKVTSSPAFKCKNIDMSARMEAEQVKLEKANPSRFKITVLKEVV